MNKTVVNIHVQVLVGTSNFIFLGKVPKSIANTWKSVQLNHLYMKERSVIMYN